VISWFVLYYQNTHWTSNSSPCGLRRAIDRGAGKSNRCER